MTTDHEPMTSEETPTGEAESAAGEAAQSTRRWGRMRGPQPGNAAPAGGGAVYGLGMIGALVYFFGTAESEQDYLLAFPKAVVWPAIMVYRVFRYLDARSA
jgi:hypothetical protein